MEERTGIRALLLAFTSWISRTLPITEGSNVGIKVKTAEGWKVVDTGRESITFTELDERYGSGNWAIYNSEKGWFE
jgi:hypothetical protein